VREAEETERERENTERGCQNKKQRRQAGAGLVFLV